MNLGYWRGCGAHGTALWRWSTAAALMALGLAACAGDDDHPGRREGFRGEGGDSRPPASRPSLFVSPAGEPFRAGPGEPYPVAVWFKGADANADGKLTRDEFVADAARFFRTLDANHDGVIDGIELKAYETEIVPEITEERAPELGRQRPTSSTFGNEQGGNQNRRRGDGDGGGGGQGGRRRGGPSLGGLAVAEGAAPYGLLGEREPVAAADLDINSRITLDNFKAKATQRFTTLDVDGKGYLLLTELPKTPAQEGGGRRGRGGPPRPPNGG